MVSQQRGLGLVEFLKLFFRNSIGVSYSLLSDLENEGAREKQINWDTLPQNVKKVQEYKGVVAKW